MPTVASTNVHPSSAVPTKGAANGNAPVSMAESNRPGSADASSDQTPWTTAPSPDDYLLLVEFAHRHLDFHDAELSSVLEMAGIRVGKDCTFVDLPNCGTGGGSRPFRILRFRWNSIAGGGAAEAKKAGENGIDNGEGGVTLPQFSVHDSNDEEQQEEKVAGRSAAATATNLVLALSRCTLIRSVAELWGAGRNMEECARAVGGGVARGRHVDGSVLAGARRRTTRREPRDAGGSEEGNRDGNGSADDAGTTDERERTWKIIVHTLGSTHTRDEQNDMRASFAFLDFQGSVVMNDPDDEFILVREIELDSQGGAKYPRHGLNREVLPENDARPPLGCYFGRILGSRTLGRNWRGSGRLGQYSLKRRTYLGPTSMDAELSLIMTNLALTKRGFFVFDPFVGTGSLLLAAALRGAYTFGTDIDLRVLRGRSATENVSSNFAQYGLPPPELVRSDNAIYRRHYRDHAPLYDAIITDPPYGIRAGARRSGSRRGEKGGTVRPVLDDNRHDHVAQTRPYAVSDVMADLLDMAARTLTMRGRLVYVIPSMTDFDVRVDLPRHDCLRLVHVCFQPLQTELGRRVVTMEKVCEYDESKRQSYLSDAWTNGPESADKVANIRARLIEAAQKKPGYEEKAALRKQKRVATREAKKRVKREASAAVENGGSDG